MGSYTNVRSMDIREICCDGLDASLTRPPRDQMAQGSILAATIFLRKPAFLLCFMLEY